MAPTFLVSPPPPGMTLSEPEVSPARLAFSLPQKGRCFPRGAGHSHLSAGVFQAFRRVSYFCVGGTDFLETGPHFSTEARRLPITQLMLQPLGHLRAPSRVFKIHELLSLQFRICHLGDKEEAPVLCQKESGDRSPGQLPGRDLAPHALLPAVFHPLPQRTLGKHKFFACTPARTQKRRRQSQR